LKSQLHNKGDLAELTVKIEKNVVDSIQEMSSNSGLTIEEIVVIALKRFRASHTDYLNKTISTDES